jgi:chemotaxis protein CheD
VNPATSGFGGQAPEGFAKHFFHDRNFDKKAAKVLPGEFYVTGQDKVIVTVLGSCVAACIRDPQTGVGGMNHFMLPENESHSAWGTSARYGTHAMELLINTLIKSGARRSHFEVKVFGGGSVMSNLSHSNVGERNAEFVIDFLKTERIPVAARDLGDIYPRKVYYFPRTGKVMVKKLRGEGETGLIETEKAYRTKLVKTPVAGDVELFG